MDDSIFYADGMDNHRWRSDVHCADDMWLGEKEVTTMVNICIYPVDIFNKFQPDDKKTMLAEIIGTKDELIQYCKEADPDGFKKFMNHYQNEMGE